MTIKLTDEQIMIQNMVRGFSREVLAATAEERDKTKEFPGENLKKMGSLGMMGMTVSPQYGGQGIDTVGHVLALSEVAYSCAATAVVMSVHNSIVCETLSKFASEIQKRTYLPRLTSAEAIGAFALTEPQAGSDPSAQRTTAVRKGDHYVLNGTKRFITSGKHCGLAIVTAKTDPARGHKGISAFIVEKGTEGFSVGREEDKMGLRASDTTDLIFDDCRVPVDNRLGEEGDGFKIAMTALDGGRIGIAAQSVGVAQAALDIAVEYAKNREQFGASISKHQGIRWTVAEMATQIEAARQLMFSAAALKDRGENFSMQASMAKLFASEMVNRVTAKALQIHGGYGVTKEYPIERLYRDCRVFTIYEGTSEIQRTVIANHVIQDRRD